MNVMDNYKVEAVLCKGGGKCGTESIKGHWTSIYDQAFNIELDNGMRFLANFKYDIKPEILMDMTSQVTSETKATVVLAILFRSLK